MHVLADLDLTDTYEVRAYHVIASGGPDSIPIALEHELSRLLAAHGYSLKQGCPNGASVEVLATTDRNNGNIRVSQQYTSKGAVRNDAALLVLEGLRSLLVTRSPKLIPVVTLVFGCEEACCHSPDQVAGSEGISRRTLDRWVSLAGIRSTRLLFAAARLARAFPLLQQNDPKNEISKTVGCASFRPIERQSIALIGARLSDVAGFIPIGEFAASILAGSSITRVKKPSLQTLLGFRCDI